MENVEKLGYKIARLSKSFGWYNFKQAVSCGLPKGSLLLFPYLDINKDKEITQKDICEHTHSKASTISVLIDDLVRDGYLVKTKSSSDSRKTLIQLTDKGTIAAHQIKDILDSTDEMMINALSEEELDVFISCLKKITIVLEGGPKDEECI